MFVTVVSKVLITKDELLKKREKGRDDSKNDNDKKNKKAYIIDDFNTGANILLIESIIKSEEKRILSKRRVLLLKEDMIPILNNIDDIEGKCFDKKTFFRICEDENRPCCHKLELNNIFNDLFKCEISTCTQKLSKRVKIQKEYKICQDCKKIYCNQCGYDNYYCDICSISFNFQ